MASRVTRSTRQQQPQLHDRATWTTPLTRTLAKLMVEHLRRGKSSRQNNSFDNKAWREICDGFYRRTGLGWDAGRLKSRYEILKRQYVLMQSMLENSSFAFDESTGTISGSDSAWAEFIKENPDVETLKTHGCPVYNDLCTIFSEHSTENGNHDQPVSSESDSESDEADHQPPETAHPSSKRARKGVDGAIANAMLEMAAASRMKASAMQRRDARYSITECIRALDEMEGVDEEVYLVALDVFEASRVAREVFLSLKGDMRLIWLRTKTSC